MLAGAAVAGFLAISLSDGPAQAGRGLADRPATPLADLFGAVSGDSSGGPAAPGGIVTDILSRLDVRSGRSGENARTGRATPSGPVGERGKRAPGRATGRAGERDTARGTDTARDGRARRVGDTGRVEETSPARDRRPAPAPSDAHAPETQAGGAVPRPGVGGLVAIAVLDQRLGHLIPPLALVSGPILAPVARLTDPLGRLTRSVLIITDSLLPEVGSILTPLVPPPVRWSGPRPPSPPSDPCEAPAGPVSPSPSGPDTRDPPGTPTGAVDRDLCRGGQLRDGSVHWGSSGIAVGRMVPVIPAGAAGPAEHPPAEAPRPERVTGGTLRGESGGSTGRPAVANRSYWTPVLASGRTVAAVDTCGPGRTAEPAPPSG